MQKIYSAPEALIEAVMREFQYNFLFSKAETTWKATVLGENLVLFEIHQKIKELVESMAKRNKQSNLITFKHVNDEIWHAEVRAEGVESFFFARMLYAVLSRMRSSSVRMKRINQEFISYLTRATALKILGSQLGLIVDARYLKGQYEIEIPIGNSVLIRSHSNPDLLCRDVVMKLKGFINSSK